MNTCGIVGQPERVAVEEIDFELRRARFLATFDAIVAELVPAAHGACRALRANPLRSKAVGSIQ